LLSILTNGCNIILDYLLIFHFQMASRGAGLATMISQYAMFAAGCGLILPFFLTNRKDITFPALLDKKALKSLVGLNRDIFIRTFLLISSFSYFINVSAELGVLFLAANSILLKVVSISSFFIDGLAFAVESFAGRLKGSQQKGALTRVIKLALGSAAGTALFFALLFNLFPDSLFYILTSQRQVLDIIDQYRLWLFPVMLIGSAAYIWDGVFLGLSRGNSLRNCMAVSAMTGFFPLAYWASKTHSIHLLWFSMALFMLIRTITLSRSMSHFDRHNQSVNNRFH
jgi:MATE family multidrug resistance protein